MPAHDQPAREEATGVVHIATDALLTLSGPDALKFLQGQTTADFSSVETLAVTPGAFCDVKGRVLADFLTVLRALDSEDQRQTVVLRMNREVADMMTQHLAKYLMFAKADLTITTGAIFGVIGAATQESLGIAIADPALAQPLDESTLAVARNQNSCEIWLLDPENSCLAEKLATTDTLPEDAWQAARIAHGEARIVAGTQGKYLPQDLNYDLIDWVSFSKGCYTGQEIIARLHWRGTPKRRLYTMVGTSSGNLTGVAATTDSPLPACGDPVLDVESERKVGSIVNAARNGDGLIVAVEATADGAGADLMTEDNIWHFKQLTAS